MKLLEYIIALWRGSIRRQLILSFGISALLLMLGFGYLLLAQQRYTLERSSEERAVTMAHALAISGTSWALANDLAGLQELVHGFSQAVDLRRAYYLNLKGEVLASTNPHEIGFFVTDALSRRMLAADARDHLVLVDQRDLIVVAHPVAAGGRQLGWARVEMSRDTVNANLAAMTGMWLQFVLFAVLMVALVALIQARRLTRGLNHLMKVAHRVESGAQQLRADTGRKDEIGVLARHFDRMLEAIAQQQRLLGESEAKYRFLADNISDVIWVYNLDRGRWEYVSPSVAKLRGHSVDEAMAQTLEQLMAPASYGSFGWKLEERSRLYRSGADGEHVYTDEVEQTRRDGSTVWTEVTTHFARNEAGEPILLGVSRDITERKRAEEQIRNLAFYDPLTQLPNRRLLLDRFGLAISTCKRSGRYAALMFIDLDNFKPLNDEYGHEVGDLLLVEVARRISGCLRAVDTVARIGGDEFVVVLSELDADESVSMQQAGAVAEKIRCALERPYRLDAMRDEEAAVQIVEHASTASIGVVLFNHLVSSREELLRLADAAMYEAKAGGRNQVRFAAR